ncbi:MAG: hypothetical protein J7621_05180 [Niastella sp.]|nr:hypothetical protein [Niastella sp.]
MNYYFIRQPSDKKIVGINDGSVQAEIVESKWKNKKELKRYTEQYILGILDSLNRMEKGEVIQPPVLEHIKVRPGAILTDFLSFSEAYAGGGYLISEKVRKVLEAHHINCRFYNEIGLFHKDKKIEGYSNLHLLPLKYRDAFSFEHSVFFTGLKLAGKTLQYAKNFDEFTTLQEEGKMLKYEVLALNGAIIGNLDMFTFDMHPRIYVSERLKEALETAVVTGIRYHEPDEPTLNII